MKYKLIVRNFQWHYYYLLSRPGFEPGTSPKIFEHSSTELSESLISYCHRQKKITFCFLNFSEWCMEALDQTIDFETIQSDELNNLLGKFYVEAAPKFSEKRSKEMPQAQSQEYHKKLDEKYKSCN